MAGRGRRVSSLAITLTVRLGWYQPLFDGIHSLTHYPFDGGSSLTWGAAVPFNELLAGQGLGLVVGPAVDSTCL